MTRQEHLDFCKARALEYVERGDSLGALTSMMSDLGKHPETTGHKGIEIGMGLLMIGALNGTADVKRFIEGFN